MKVAVIGSREFTDFDIAPYIPENTTEIVSGGAVGVDTVAKRYALKNNIKYKEFLPEYQKYGRRAPLVRNDAIIDYSDLVMAFWNGHSKGTKYVINQCQKKCVPLYIYMPENTPQAAKKL